MAIITCVMYMCTFCMNWDYAIGSFTQIKAYNLQYSQTSLMQTPKGHRKVISSSYDFYHIMFSLALLLYQIIQKFLFYFYTDLCTLNYQLNVLHLTEL